MVLRECCAKFVVLNVVVFLLVAQASLITTANAKVDCGPVVNKGNDFARSVAIGTSPAGTGAFPLGSGLPRWRARSHRSSPRYRRTPAPIPSCRCSKRRTRIGIVNILDAHMAMTGTGTYKKAYPSLRVLTGGVFPFTGGIMVRDKSDIRQVSDLKGKRLAWDFGGHAVIEALLNAALETGGIKPADITQVRLTTSNDGIRGVADGKVDATYASSGPRLTRRPTLKSRCAFSTFPTVRRTIKYLAGWARRWSKPIPPREYAATPRSSAIHCIC